ncbi:MAG: hypothetical protein FRX48_02452 [Lasallia pustulata]|uniref:FAD-binding FR-type domain-containing protein n=1 Tax=Lasallia pustulata TaxID=136370 RepID=A0A5M8PZI4_9LECA|nr:MAG: hypothetical protein FRX48_02452 [Lasallia pustulata]
MASTTTGGGGYASVSPALKARRQLLNVRTAKYFAVAIAALMGLFIIYHWTWFFYHRYGPKERGPGTKTVVGWQRGIRRFLFRRFAGYRLDRSIVVVTYLAINIVLIFSPSLIQYHFKPLISSFAKRFGWIAVSNLALVFFLALKNTPLAFLSATSYEKLQPLHQIAGYWTVFAAILHGVLYTITFSQSHVLYLFKERDQYVGVIAGFALLTILVSTISVVRQRRYEVFYVVHISMIIVILITVGLHRPDLTTRTLVIVIFAASCWFLDRVLRSAKTTWYFYGNSATLTALPNNATRVVLRRSIKASPGSHAFLWIPAIRAAETHPVTLVSANPVEFVLKAHDGFTSDLLKHALEAPDARLRCSLDGPYGATPDFKTFDKVVLVAGGSGASFAFAVATDIVRNVPRTKKISVDFVWVVKFTETLTWFEKELRQLRDDPRINLIIHTSVSAATSIVPSIDPALSNSDISATSTVAPSHARSLHLLDKADISPAMPQRDPEKGASGPWVASTSPSLYSLDIQLGRPSVPNLVRRAVNEVRVDGSVAVGVCGPASLLHVTRDAVAECIAKDGPSVTMHSETFGW